MGTVDGSVRLGWGCAACTSVMVQEEEEEEEEEEPTDAELQVLTP